MTTRHETFNFRKRMAVLKAAIGKALSSRGKFTPEDVDAIVEAVMLAGHFKQTFKTPHRYESLKNDADNLVEVFMYRKEAEDLLQKLAPLEITGKAKKAVGSIMNALDSMQPLAGTKG